MVEGVEGCVCRGKDLESLLEYSGLVGLEKCTRGQDGSYAVNLGWADNGSLGKLVGFQGLSNEF